VDSSSYDQTTSRGSAQPSVQSQVHQNRAMPRRSSLSSGRRRDSASERESENGSDNARDGERPRRRSSVSFGEVRVREHEVVLGDHPCCKSFPVTLGWNHSSEDLVTFLTDLDDESVLEPGTSISGDDDDSTRNIFSEREDRKSQELRVISHEGAPLETSLEKPLEKEFSVAAAKQRRRAPRRLSLEERMDLLMVGDNTGDRGLGMDELLKQVDAMAKASSKSRSKIVIPNPRNLRPSRSGHKSRRRASSSNDYIMAVNGSAA